MIGLRASSELRAQIEKWAGHQDDKPGLSEAIRRLVEAALHTSHARKPPNKTTAHAAAKLAHRAIEAVADKSLPDEELKVRKRRLLKGPSEFRDMRRDQPKNKR